MSDDLSMIVKEELHADPSGAAVVLDTSQSDRIDLVTSPGPMLIGEINIHWNLLIIHSSKEGVIPRKIIIPTINEPLSEEKKAEIIQRERQKMDEEASVTETTVTDPSGEGVAVAVTDLSGELVE